MKQKIENLKIKKNISHIVSSIKKNISHIVSSLSHGQALAAPLYSFILPSFFPQHFAILL